MFRIRASSFVAGFAAASAISLYQLQTGVWASHQDLGNMVIFLILVRGIPFYHTSIRSTALIMCQIACSDSRFLLANSVSSMSTRLGLPYLNRLSSTQTGVFVLSHGFLVSKLRSYHTCYTNVFLSLPISSGDVAETHQNENPLSGTDNEVSGDGDVVDGP